MSLPLFQGVFHQDNQPQMLEDCIHQLLLTSKPAKTVFEGNECLDEGILENLWGSIVTIGSKEELQKRILTFYEGFEEATEKEVLILLEILEYLFSKHENKALSGCLAGERIFKFLKFAVSSAVTEIVRFRALYLMTLISYKVKTTVIDTKPIVELKDGVERETGMKYTGSLNSKYFVLGTDKSQLSPGKQTHFLDSKAGKNPVFENAFNPLKENPERRKSEKLEFGTMPEIDLIGKFQSHSLGSSPEYTMSGEASDLCFSSDGNELYNQLDIQMNAKKILNNSTDSNINTTIDSLGGLQFKVGTSEDPKSFFEQYDYSNVSSNPMIGNNQGIQANYNFDLSNQTQFNNPWMRPGPGDAFTTPTLQDRVRPQMTLRVNTMKTNDQPMSPSRMKAQGQEIGSPLSGTGIINSPLLMTNSSPMVQDPSRYILERLENSVSSRGVLQLEDLLEFKRLNCQKSYCPLKNFIVTQNQFLCENDMYACPFYHNHGDRRRYPLHKNNLAKSFYVHDKLCEDCFNDPNKHKGRCYYCKNWFELFYHPKNYKLVPCQNKLCDKKHNLCPFYHNLGEKYEWDQILMNSFQYDRRNITLNVEILRNPSSQQQQQQSQQQQQNKPSILPLRTNSVNFQQSPLQSPTQGPLQFRQMQPQSPYYAQNLQQQQPQSPYFQNQQGGFQLQTQQGSFQLPPQQQPQQFQQQFLNQKQQPQQIQPIYSTQYPRNKLIDYQQQHQPQPNMSSPNSWGNYSMQSQDMQYNQEQFEKLSLGWNPTSNQPLKKPLNVVSQSFSTVSNNNHIKQMFPGISNTTNSPLFNPNNMNPSSPLLTLHQSKSLPLNPTKNLIFPETFNIDEGNHDDEYDETNDIAKNFFDFVEISEKDSLIINKPLKSGLFTDGYKQLELRPFKGPILTETQKEQVLRAVCGFLNGGGGQIYLGVSEEGNTVGISMTPKEYEAFKGDFVTALLELFSPPVDDSLYSIRKYFALETPKQQINPDTWKNIAVEITIKSNEKVYFLKEKGKQLCYQRYDGVTRSLQGDQINELFKKKMADMVMKQQYMQGNQNLFFGN